MRVEPVALPLSVLSERVQPLADPAAPIARRTALAKATVPLPPEELVPGLCFLLQDKENSIREEARRSIEGMPEGSIQVLIQNHTTTPGVLDGLARVLHQRENIATTIALNRGAADNTLLFLAANGRGQFLDVIATNHVRLQACPKIVEALYFNRHLRMGTAAALMEFAVRANLPLQNMPGYQEIVAAVLGEHRPKPVTPQPQQPPSSAQAQQPLVSTQPPPAQPAQPPAPQQTQQATAQPASDAAKDSQAYEEILARALSPDGEEVVAQIEQELAAQTSENPAEQAAEEKTPAKGGSIYDMVREMNVPDRIRLALMGNFAARKVLAADANRLVASAVMRNPGLTEKEVAALAANKSVSEEVIRIICNSRDLVKNYMVKVGLIKNPKTPFSLANSFIKYLNDKDLKTLSKSRDVSGAITRQCKRIMDERYKGGH